MVVGAMEGLPLYMDMGKVTRSVFMSCSITIWVMSGNLMISCRYRMEAPSSIRMLE